MSLITKIIVLFILVSADISLSADVNAKNHKIRGGFTEITFSDYMYINIDIEGTKQTFYCVISACAEWEKNQAQYEGKMLELKIRSKNFYFKELKTSRKIDEVLELHVVGPKK